MQQSPKTDFHFVGYDLTLSCFISVDSDIVNRVSVAATWFKDGIAYNANWDSRLSVTPVIPTAGGVYTTNLTFAPLNSGDSGRYQCTASLSGLSGTSFANASYITSVIVEGQQFVVAG